MPITGRARLFAILGDPVGVVRSPEWWNAAFGRAGDATNPPERLAAKPRDRVPCQIFRAPVTVACEGVFPWLRPVDPVYRKGASARLLYRDLAFAAEDVLQLWPGGGSGM